MNQPLYAKLIKDALNGQLGGANGPLYYLNSMLYGIPGELGVFHPDINGYTLMFMMPPHLSGYGLSDSDMGPIGKHCKMICLLGIDFTPPTIQVTASELPAHTGALPFGAQVNPTGQLTITYLDDQHNRLFAYHKLWISYIEDILRGKTTANNIPIAPDPIYYTPNDDPSSPFGQIDYMTSAYVVRTKPTRGLAIGDINYVGKATGIFPLNSPDKEIIGRRDSNEITMFPISYACAWYRQYTLGLRDTLGGDVDDFILSEFYDKIMSVYGSGDMGLGGIIDLAELAADTISFVSGNLYST